MDQSPLLSSLFFFISLSHTSTHPNIRSVSHSSLSSLLCQSYLSCHAATHFPSLLNSFLSIPLALIFALAPALSCFSPQWAVSLSRSAEQRAWVRLQNSLQWIDKNRALVAAAGWKEGKREGRDGDKYLKKEGNKKGKERLGRKGGGGAGRQRGVRGAAGSKDVNDLRVDFSPTLHR